MIRLRVVFFVLVTVGALIAPREGRSQANPTGFYVDPQEVVQGEWYGMVAYGAANMTLDLEWWGPTCLGCPATGPHYIWGWPTLNAYGVAWIETSATTLPGEFTFTRIKNSLSPNWVDVYAVIRVYAYVPQPTGLAIDSSSGYAGNDAYTITVANGANMSVDVGYTLNGDWLEGTIQTDSNGQYYYALDHYVANGSYIITKIKNQEASEWVDIPPVYYEIYPPHPTSLTVNKSAITAGGGQAGTYLMHANNGAEMYIDFGWKLNGSGTQYIYSWPYLAADYYWSPDGTSYDIVADACTTPGGYLFTSVGNNANGWQEDVSPPAALTVYPPGSASISSVTPATGARGSNVNVTIAGLNMCNASMSTSWPGLTFTNFNSPHAGNLITATFNISPTAWVGLATVTIQTTYGNLTVNFNIANNAPPSISSIAPASGPTGASVPVTITGQNLAGAVLSTTWNGLTFSNVSSNPNGSVITATLNIASSAPEGSPPIKATTSAGNATSTLFSVTAPAVMSLTREYIYLGERLIAVDSP